MPNMKHVCKSEPNSFLTKSTTHAVTVVFRPKGIKLTLWMGLFA